MKIGLSLLIILFTLSGCETRSNKDYLYIYEPSDELFVQTKKYIKKDYPEYFINIPENQVFGVQVYGEKVECVQIFNKTGIIAERSPALYCFDYYSRKFVTKL